MSLHIQLTKRTDGSVILRCTREDGSVTWQKHEKLGAFYSFHDLTHYAVETAFGFKRGFFGLIADGWSIEDTSGKGSRGKLSYDSGLVEHVVGLFDRERSGGVGPLSGAAFSALIEEMMGVPLAAPFTDQQLKAARERIASLHQQWISIPKGSSLELTFNTK
jgi:hypothetical protein